LVLVVVLVPGVVVLKEVRELGFRGEAWRGAMVVAWGAAMARDIYKSLNEVFLL
jgi:hypothetical protein